MKLSIDKVEQLQVTEKSK